jgi:TolB protein
MTILVFAAAALAQPGDFAKSEAEHLTNIKQVTTGFVRAGEGYFSPDGATIIFQAEEKESGNPFYQIYTQKLDGGRAHRVSPGVGKTTCAYFSPDGKKIIFASSHFDPEAKDKYAPEFKQREEDKKSGHRRRYQWDFDPHMDIFEADPDGTNLRRLTDADGYDAEGSYSPDGQWIVFCSERTGKGNFELFIMDKDGKQVRQLTKTPGCYNGGPFFSPDGKRVIFRSDRTEKDRLQLYVINSDGSGERALTNEPAWVQWGPYWHPDNKHIIYAGADHSDPTARPNYDLYWMNVETGKKLRITHSPSADVLPVFSPDGKKLMWTSTRTADRSSQLFIADFKAPKE